MCGIAGIIGSHSDQFDIDLMLNRIRHRGPDGCFTSRFDNLSLAHARLSIIDLTADANQPMTDPDSGNTIVFNGEIYNYVELKKEIGDRYRFRTTSDTEVILACFRVFGDGFLSKLRGMFAFALYDPTARRVMLARDRMGIKPLYVRRMPGSVLFASEIKSLAGLPGITDSVNELKAYEFMANCQLDTGAETLFAEVEQLLPATYAWVSLNGQMDRPKTYWQIPEPGRRKLDETARQDFISLFRETVSLHLRSDVPVGSFVSGGIDSSLVSCMAEDLLSPRELHTFSAVLPYFHPENALISTMLDSGKRFVPHTFMLDGQGFFDDVQKVIYHHDEPIMDGSMYAHFKLCSIARNEHIKVVLSGSGGDELFGGYPSHIYAAHARLLKQGRMSRYISELRRVSRGSRVAASVLLLRSMYECVPVPIRRSLKNVQLKKKFRHLDQWPDVRHFHHAHPDPYHANLINNYRSWTAPPFLHYEDRNSMAHGVEARVPFFDHCLLEFVLQFDSGELIRGRTKSLLRDSFRSLVPEAVLDQKGKYGFPSPIDHALRHDQKGKEFYFDSISSTPMLNKTEAERLGRNFYEHDGDVSIFWRVLSFMIWYRIFFLEKNYA